MHDGARLHRGEVTGRWPTAPYGTGCSGPVRWSMGVAVFWLVVAMLLSGTPRVTAQQADPLAHISDRSAMVVDAGQ